MATDDVATDDVATDDVPMHEARRTVIVREHIASE
jgi:hypothetical protein